MESVTNLVRNNPKSTSWILILLVVVVIVLTILLLWKIFKKENMTPMGNLLNGMASPIWYLGGANAGSDPNLTNEHIDKELPARFTQEGRDLISKMQLGIDYPLKNCEMGNDAAQEAMWLHQAGGGEYVQMYDQAPAMLTVV